MGTDLAPGLTSLRADASKGGREKREQEGNVAQKMLIFNSGNHLFFFFFPLCITLQCISPSVCLFGEDISPQLAERGEGRGNVR